VKTDKGKEITEKLKKMGYDGVIKRATEHAHDFDKSGKGKIKEIVAFYPHQIKSAIGSEYGPNLDITK